MKRYRAFLFLPLALLLAACSANPVPKPPGPDDSFVYGYIDMDEAPVDLHWLTLKRVRPATETPYWNAGTNDGVFFNWYLEKGSYTVTQFGGSGGNTNYTFNVPRQLTDMRLVVEKQGIYFLGSYKYKGVKTGFFEAGKYDLEKVDTPTEREVVEKLLTLVKGTAVEPKLRNHLKGMK